MTIPVEIIIAGLGFNGAILTILGHILIRVMDGQAKMSARQGIIEYKLGIAPRTEE